MGLSVKSVVFSVIAYMVFPVPYSILVLSISWFFYLGSLDHYVNLMPLPVCEALIRIRLFIDFEVSIRGLGLGLIVCAILPFARFCAVFGFVVWMMWTLFIFGRRFIGIDEENNTDELNKWQHDVNMSIRDTFKQLNVLIYRIVTHSGGPSIDVLLNRLNKTLVNANAKVADYADQYRQAVTQLTKSIGQLEEVIISCKNELEDCKQSKSGLENVVQNVQQDVATSKNFFSDIDSKLAMYNSTLKSKMHNQFYWKMASFMFFPFVIGYIMNRGAILRIKRMIETYTKQLELHDNMIKERSTQEEALLRKELATEDWQRRLRQRLRASNEQLAQKKEQRESTLTARQTIKNVIIFLTQFQNKVDAVRHSSKSVDGQYSRESVVSGVEDILCFLEPLVHNGNLERFTTPALLDNFSYCYRQNDLE